MENGVVKIRNGQRALKSDKRRVARATMLTPPRVIDKNSKVNMYNKFEKQMGYDYDSGDSRTLKWMKEDFNLKMAKYLGKKVFAPKRSRMDKVRMKEEINFTLEMNPLVRIMSKLNDKMEKQLLQDALACLYS
jgi:hypothetical protein